MSHLNERIADYVFEELSLEDMAEALGLDAPVLVEQTPAEDELPLEEPEADIENEETPDEEPGGSLH